MRASLSSLLLAAACVAGVGCASKPAQEAAVASTDTVCTNDTSNSLHLTSQSSQPIEQRDAATESILAQQTSDGRLAQINRSMYWSLRTLDAELRREQRIDACEQAPFGNTAMLRAQVDNKSDGASVTVGDSGVVSSSAAAGGGVTRALRKTSMSGSSGGGNGATAPKYVPGSDNQIVARRLKKAAEQETNPSLRAKLWKEYTDYVQGASAK